MPVFVPLPLFGKTAEGTGFMIPHNSQCTVCF